MDKRLSPVYKNKIDFVEENLKGSFKILDVGCGEGHYFHLYKGLDYVGVDVEVYDDSHIIKGVAEELPFEDSSFDTVVCMDVLEHVYDDVKALQEIHRVLKLGGKLLMSVPNNRFPWTYDPINAFLRLFRKHVKIGIWSWGHRRLYSKEIMDEYLRVVGFDVVQEKDFSHGFLAAFVNYIPYVVSLFKKRGFKKKEDTTESFIYKVYQVINNVDKKYFKWTEPIMFGYEAKKK